MNLQFNHIASFDSVKSIHPSKKGIFALIREGGLGVGIGKHPEGLYLYNDGDLVTYINQRVSRFNICNDRIYYHLNNHEGDVFYMDINTQEKQKITQSEKYGLDSINQMDYVKIIIKTNSTLENRKVLVINKDYSQTIYPCSGWFFSDRVNCFFDRTAKTGGYSISLCS